MSRTMRRLTGRDRVPQLGDELSFGPQRVIVEEVSSTEIAILPHGNTDCEVVLSLRSLDFLAYVQRVDGGPVFECKGDLPVLAESDGGE